MSEMVEAAAKFATIAHASVDQRRKYTGEPYIVHPQAVAALVASVPHDDAMIAAAWLHDTVEDCGVLIETIEHELGADVASLVEWLTDVSKLADGNRKIRKTIDRLHSAAAPARAQTIKIADLIDNSRTILMHDPDFARVYLREKEALLDLLVLADPQLIKIAKMQLEEFTGIIH